MFYVSRYEQVQRYGGPQEGGWWYTVMRHMETMKRFYHRSDAIKHAEKCRQQESEQNLRLKQAYVKHLADMPEGESPYNDTEGYIPTGYPCDGEIAFVVEKIPGENDNTDSNFQYE